MPHALAIRDLRRTFAGPDGKRLLVLDLPRLDLDGGRRLAVVGESGSGKTTLLHLISGVLPVEEGSIEICGEPMDGLGEDARDRLRARRVGYLFQTFNLLPHLSALENVALGLAFRPRGGGAPLRQVALEALDRVGLAQRVDHRPTQLSVGQQQRVAIARALAGRPALLLADEPTANLDPRRSREALDLMLAFAEESEAAVLVVTHDERVLERFEDHLELRMPSGRTASS